jgi:tRNA(Ile)-lysidine synthase
MAQVADALPQLFNPHPPRLALAYSGGADSSALLHLAHGWAREHGVHLIACHVHHGLSPDADAWLAHCQQTCAELGIAFASERIHLAQQANLEARARAARYAALARMCGAHQATLLLTAHHQQDQAETVLLQWMRGAQPATGMEALSQITPGQGSAPLWLARPLLDCPRQPLLALLTQRNGTHVEDASNLDPRFARNALRHRVLPALGQIFPAAPELLARNARHGQTTRRLLHALAEQDLARFIGPDAARAALHPDQTAHADAAQALACATPDADADAGAPSLPLAVICQLDAERAQNVLRYWLQAFGLRLPSAAWLAEAMHQLQHARADAQLCVNHPLAEIHRYRERIYLTPPAPPPAAAQPFQWHGEAQLDFPGFAGCLRIEPAAPGSPGIDAGWLRAQRLQIDHRQGGERLKLAPNRPSRSLKQHYQAQDIPGWLRARLPLISLLPQAPAAAPNPQPHPPPHAPPHAPHQVRPDFFQAAAQPTLLFAAGIGTASQFLIPADSDDVAVQRINFRWHCLLNFK